MTPLFKLVKKEFIEEEWRWTYLCLIHFTFNKEKISEITITDHYQKEHSEITNELIF